MRFGDRLRDHLIWGGAVFIAGMLVLVLSLTTLVFFRALEARAEQPASAWYSYFDYAGRRYAWSYAYAEAEWVDIIEVDDYPNVSDPPDGNVPGKGQDWCEQLVGEPGWFLPNLGEALAGRNNYVGGDPLAMEEPDGCGPISYNGKPQLWTSTSCDATSTTWHRRAYAVHALGLDVDDADAGDIAHCENDGRLSYWCCWQQKNYYGHHWCPQARCVKVVDDGGADPTPFPVSPTPGGTPEPQFGRWTVAVPGFLTYQRAYDFARHFVGAEVRYESD